MTPDELRALAVKATPGPWQQSPESCYINSNGVPIAFAENDVNAAVQGNDFGKFLGPRQARANAAFIAAANPQAILELLDRVKEARNEALEEAARCAASVKGGFSANLDVDGPELVRDEDGPWVINGDIAAAIRALKTEKAPSK